MATVILKWNPAFSSFSMMRYLEGVRNAHFYDAADFNWSVWDHDKIHAGDRCYWLKVGMYGQTGIVGRGTITSEPYESEDWSGQGRKTYYVDFNAETLLNPDALPILTTVELQKELPDFQWNGGHSGLVLTPEQAEKLDYIWSRFIRTNAPAFEKSITLKHCDGDLIYSKAYNEAHRVKKEEEQPIEEEIQRKEYLNKIRTDAEEGIWSEDVRELIDGFDLINGKIGNFHDSEVVDFEINYQEDFIRLKLHMDNETNTLLELRFEGDIYQDICMDDLKNPGFGYFYRDNDRVVLEFEEYDVLRARKIKVISLTPWKE